MIPRVFEWAAASSDVTALLGVEPTRFWPFASAPQPGKSNAQVPYAVWQLLFGSPDNYLDKLPDADGAVIGVTCYAATLQEARNVMLALRGALEPHGYVTGYAGEDRDPATQLFRCGFTIDFWTTR